MAERPSQPGSPDSKHLFTSHGFDEEMAKKGRELITQIHILIKTAQIHGPTNVALAQQLEQAMRTITDLWRWSDDVCLRLEGEYIYLDELKLKMDIEGFASFTAVIDIFKHLGVGTVNFKKPASEEEVSRFIYLLVQADPNAQTPFKVLTDQMSKSGILNIEIEEWEERKDSFDQALFDTKAAAKSTYFRTMTAVSEVMENVKLGQAVSVKRAKRVVQSMVDLLLQDESTLLGLTTLRSHDEYTHNHSVNVCILSLAVAQHLGYSKKQLTDIGIAALFHDIGKAEIPAEILNKPSEFTEEEWQIMRRHPVLGVKYIIKLKGINDTTIRMVTGIFEHHLNYDVSGYPKIDRPWELSLLGRIIGIVDCYDALTSSRVYNRQPYSPEKALKYMISKSGRAFDPTLMKIFVNSIGIFPIGTFVLLDTFELAVVIQANSNPGRAERPKVKVIADPSGRELDGRIIDLSEQDEKTEQYTTTILKTVDSTKYKVDVSRFFL